MYLVMCGVSTWAGYGVGPNRSAGQVGSGQVDLGALPSRVAWRTNRAMPYRAVPCRAVPCRAVPCRRVAAGGYTAPK